MNMKKKLTACVLAGLMSFSLSLGAQAASRAEVAAISVTTAADFQYWEKGSPTMAKLTKFVKEATDPKSPRFIPEADRVAVFDMDGTFYCETAPFYFQEMMFLYRALEDKSYTPDKKISELSETEEQGEQKSLHST